MSLLRKLFIQDSNGNDLEAVSPSVPVLKVALHDGDGNPVSSLKGALDTHDADVHNEIINRYMHEHTATQTTLLVATSASGGDYTITVVSAAGFAVGDFLHIGDGTYEITHPKIISIAANVFTLDRRIDKAHAIGTSVIKSILNMAPQIGTLATPREYWVGPTPGEVWHLTRIIITMVHTSAGDMALFGNLPALTNGVLIRADINGQYATLTNWKTNQDIASDMYDVRFDTRAGGSGSWGTTARGSFSRAGAVVRLDGNTGDRLEVYVQDDLSGLTSFQIKAQGHFEGV